jgi:hypothetical protein
MWHEASRNRKFVGARIRARIAVSRRTQATNSRSKLNRISWIKTSGNRGKT